MSVTLTVERYDGMQKELATLRERTQAYNEGKLFIWTRLDRWGRTKNVYLTQEVIDGLNKDLLARVISLEAKVLPGATEKKLGWWHGVWDRLQNTGNND